MSNKPPRTVPVIVDRPMTPKELASFLKVSLPTLRRALKNENLPHIRIGAQIRFLPSEVVLALQNRKKA